MADKYWLGDDSGSPGDWDTAANWSASGVPTTGDSVYLTGSQSVTSGLDQSAVALVGFTVLPDFTGEIGTVNSPLLLDCDTFSFAGQGKAYIQLLADITTVEVLNTASVNTAEDAGLWLASEATTGTDKTITNLIVKKGSVALPVPGLEATVTNVFVGYDTQKASDAKVVLNSDAAVTTVKQTGGNNICRTNLTTLAMYGGTLTLAGSATITTLNGYGGTFVDKSTGTIATINLNGLVIDAYRDQQAKTFTTINATSGTLMIDTGVVTLTNDINPSGRVNAVFTAIEE